MSGGEAGNEASPRRSYAKGVARRSQIIESAIEEFADHGVDGTSLRTLGDAIGVSHATLRHYFATRDELLVEVYRAHEQNSVGEAFGSPMPEGESVVEAMAASADRNSSIPGLVRLYATLSSDAVQAGHPVSEHFVRERFRGLRALLAEHIRAGQAAGDIAADFEAEDAAALVIAASDGLQVQWLLDPDDVDVRRSLALLERLLPGAEHDTK
ncbi:TetR/AcrR family transcriptional regulator [Humibacter ginsenosidimutans]|uniref:TetR/AcrR family transcriptional regulator n=1 Tax=Humibacter ginsenosidimutans TaxID=2599293 RepID=A0A5B8M5M8_9MICO|nr:TetR/AcrR family transcriptional regulator [Humibacter ginsenosidimutans]QDZ15389.1 TetR/AcrR family transcriptional regulator [Humibacter ginsenosidimutans]